MDNTEQHEKVTLYMACYVGYGRFVRAELTEASTSEEAYDRLARSMLDTALDVSSLPLITTEHVEPVLERGESFTVLPVVFREDGIARMLSESWG